MVLRLRKVVKSFAPGGVVLDIAQLEIGEGQQLALRGKSGSGKSTLLNLIAGILRADSGTIEVDGQELGKLSETGRDQLRGRKLGYVFQSFHLLAGLTVWENLWLASVLSGAAKGLRIEQFLERLDLKDRRDYRPGQLSLGQQQRVAVARALVHQPRLVLADEPTGNLDAEMAQQALLLLRNLCQENGAALLLVSHDAAILNSFDDCLDLAEINRACC